MYWGSIGSEVLVVLRTDWV